MWFVTFFVILRAMGFKILCQLDPGNIKSLDIFQDVPDSGAESTRSIFRNTQLYMFFLSQLSSFFLKHFCKIQT